MTEVQIVGGPRDGETLDTAGNPEHGERLHHDGSTYRLYERTDGSWVGVWGGYLTVDARDLIDGDELTDREVAKLAAALREHEAGRARNWRRLALTLTLAAFGASIGAAFVLTLVLTAGLGWLFESLAGLVGGWTNLALGFAFLGAIVCLTAALANWEDLDTIDNRKDRR